MLNYKTIIATKLVREMANIIINVEKVDIVEEPLGAILPTRLLCPPLAVAEHAAVPHA